jgi:hypothetical protein
VICGLEQMIHDAVLTKNVLLCVLERIWEEGFTTTLMYYMDLYRWYWMMFWPKLWFSLYWNRCEWMISWPNMKCYVDCKVSYRKVSRQILSTMWIRSFYRGRCHDLNWSDMWTGQDVTKSFHDQFEIIWLSTDDKEWCHDLIWHNIWIGLMLNDAVLNKLQCYVDCIVCDRKCHVQFEVLFGLEQMIQDDDVT